MRAWWVNTFSWNAVKWSPNAITVRQSNNLPHWHRHLLNLSKPQHTSNRHVYMAIAVGWNKPPNLQVMQSSSWVQALKIAALKKLHWNASARMLNDMLGIFNVSSISNGHLSPTRHLPQIHASKLGFRTCVRTTYSACDPHASLVSQEKITAGIKSQQQKWIRYYTITPSCV